MNKLRFFFKIAQLSADTGSSSLCLNSAWSVEEGVVCFGKGNKRDAAIRILTDKPPHGDRRFWGEGDGFTKYSQTFLTKRSQNLQKGIHKAFTRAFTKPSQKHSQNFHKDIHKTLTNSLARSAAIFQDPPPTSQNAEKRRRRRRKRGEEEKKRREH